MKKIVNLLLFTFVFMFLFIPSIYAEDIDVERIVIETPKPYIETNESIYMSAKAI